MKRDFHVEAALAFAYRQDPGRFRSALDGYSRVTDVSWQDRDGNIYFRRSAAPGAEPRVQEALAFAARHGHARALDEYCNARNFVWGTDDDGNIVFAAAHMDDAMEGIE